MIGLLKKAKEMSEKSTHPHYPMVAFAMKGGNIVEWGTNRYSKINFPKTLHCEEALAQKLGRRGETISKVFIFRFKGSGSLGLARPCLRCREALREVGVTRIVFSSDNGFITEKI